MDRPKQPELPIDTPRPERLDAIGRLAGGIAHEFNNLLTAILGNAERALARLDPMDPGREDVVQIRTAGRRGVALAGDLLAASGHQMLQVRRLLPGALLAELSGPIRGELRPSVALELDVAPGLPAVQADQEQLGRALLHLVRNANEVMAAGGRLTVRGRERTLGAEEAAHGRARPGRFVVLTVADTGPAIPEETQEELFEPFADLRRGREGLWLAAARGIIGQHGGWVEVESGTDSGTRFDLYLPVAEGGRSEEAVEFVPESGLAGGGRRILVIEDEEAVRELAVAYLEDDGYRTLEAGSVAEALAHFEREPMGIDAVFSDVVLPDGTGVEAVARMRRLRPGLPVVMTSGFAGQTSAWQAIDTGGDPFLHKPYSPADLLLALREALDSPPVPTEEER